MLSCILDTMIPADPEHGMPSAAEIGFASYSLKYNLQELCDLICAQVSATSHEHYGLSFQSLGEEERLRTLNLCRRLDIRLFSAFIGQVFRAYYSHAEVLMRIGAGAVPPFPHGNAMREDDWSILEPVFNRGAIYRKVG